jgi:hypothetical protein
VTEWWHGHCVGRALVRHVLSLIQPPAEVVVTAIGEDTHEGGPAGRFYVSMHSQRAEAGKLGPYGR